MAGRIRYANTGSTVAHLRGQPSLGRNLQGGAGLTTPDQPALRRTGCVIWQGAGAKPGSRIPPIDVNDGPNMCKSSLQEQT